MNKYLSFVTWLLLTCSFLSSCSSSKPEIYNYNINLKDVKVGDSETQVLQKLGAPQAILYHSQQNQQNTPPQFNKEQVDNWYYITGIIYKDSIGKRLKYKTVVTIIKVPSKKDKLHPENNKVISTQYVVKKASLKQIQEFETEEFQSSNKFSNLFKNVVPRPI